MHGEKKNCVEAKFVACNVNAEDKSPIVRH